MELEQYTQYTRLKRNAYYEIFNIFLRQNQVNLDLKDTFLVMEVTSWVLPLGLLPETKINLVFLELQEIFFLGPLKVNIVYFSINFFHFTKKLILLLTMQAFFRNILPYHTLSNPNDIFY